MKSLFPVKGSAKSMLSTRDIVLCALFAAIVAALGLLPPIPLGFLPVPITAQSMGVMLAGALLGPKRAFIALGVFVLLVLAGLPLLSGGRGGIGLLMGPTGGFLLAFPLSAATVGFLAERFDDGGRPLVLFAACILGGIGVMYAVGVPWLSLVGGIGFMKAAAGSMAFLPGDLVKAGAAAFVAAGVRRAHPTLLARG